MRIAHKPHHFQCLKFCQWHLRQGAAYAARRRICGTVPKARLKHAMAYAWHIMAYAWHHAAYATHMPHMRRICCARNGTNGVALKACICTRRICSICVAYATRMRHMRCVCGICVAYAACASHMRHMPHMRRQIKKKTICYPNY